ncbi:MAG TPA: DNA methyltransferase [Pirellulales bacterium]|nr:DNA methyltransferase [Pirellulales bacterium]
MEAKPKVQIFNEDCIAGMAERVSSSSVHLTVTSIPFEELFTYSGKLEDVGNNGSTIDIRSGRFALNMRFVVEQLHRVTAPGCNVCIHIQQLLAYKNQHGFIGRRDFRGAMIDVFGAGGFQFVGEFAIQKNPQAMAQRLNLHSLMFITGKRNANHLAPCPNDYVLVFHKPGECACPVRALSDTKLNPEGWLSTEEWIRDAHGIWTDILEIDVLDGARTARESDQEKHVCPLQLEVIRRLVRLYSNPITVQPDVLVLDPFMGIGSTAWVCVGAPSPVTGLAVDAPRNVIGFELKESYHAGALKNVAKARAAVRNQQKEAAPLFQ